jgi:hypothetical protein
MKKMFALYNKGTFLYPLVFIPLLIAVFGCAQDSIFYGISNEVAPTDPLIVGGPTKIVRANEKLYVANGTIYEYDTAGNGTWVGSPKPDGKVQDLAVVSGPGGDTLYALSVTGTGLDFTLWEWDKTTTGWKPIGIDGGDYTVIQNIFGGGDTLFAGVSRSNGDGGNDYAVYYKEGDKLHLLGGSEETAILSGAGRIGTDYYLATIGSGIYKATFGSPPAASEVTTIPHTNITGFLQYNYIDSTTSSPVETIIGVTRDGYIVRGTSAGFTSPTTSLGVALTGAIALAGAYDYSTTPPASGAKLLLLGIRGGYSSTVHGYVEVDFGEDPLTIGNSYREPGRTDPTGIAQNENYRSTLRKYPVTSIVFLPRISTSTGPGAPDNAGDPIMFASTPKDGFYSYRNRSDGGWQWNHEE